MGVEQRFSGGYSCGRSDAAVEADWTGYSPGALEDLEKAGSVRDMKYVPGIYMSGNFRYKYRGPSYGDGPFYTVGRKKSQMQKVKTFCRFEVNFLDGPVFRALVFFALPLFVSNIFQQLYNTVDTMIVGNYLGDLSLAAIGACSAIYELLVGFALGIGNGLTIVTARSYGAGDESLLKNPWHVPL